MLLTRSICVALVCFVMQATLIGCRISDDAIAASSQMQATASALSDFYAMLSADITDSIALYELDGATSGVPYTAQDRALQQVALVELRKRGELARSLSNLAIAMTRLSDPTQVSNLQNAATELGNELIKVNALSSDSPAPEALGRAGRLFLQMAQQREEKKAARAMDETVTAIADLFDKERPVYDSIARNHLRLAKQVAGDLIRAGAVDTSGLLAPALKPFGLYPSPAFTAPGALQGLALTRLQAAADQAISAEQDASTAMLQALREMSSRIHLLATARAMPSRGNPVSLRDVEDWVHTTSAFAGLRSVR